MKIPNKEADLITFPGTTFVQIIRKRKKVLETKGNPT